MSRALVVGAGWSGAVVAHQLHHAGWSVEVLEAGSGVGGHARVERLNGVVYEPNGAHIFHTDDAEVAGFAQAIGIDRPFSHEVVTEVVTEYGPVFLSWPPQLDEVERLPEWPVIKYELDNLPPEPPQTDFVSHVVGMMGRTMYDLFVGGYTRKQWGCDPSELSWRLAPKRVELRRDGKRGLFRDRWQWFPKWGPNEAIERLLRPVAVTCNAHVTADELADDGADVVVVTAACDEFLGTPMPEAWRGVWLRSTYHPTDTPGGTRTPAYVVNHPDPDVAYTRTVETKHATGQQAQGTVVSEEYPGAPARHYPIPTTSGTYERHNAYWQRHIAEVLDPSRVAFVGRLATYCYIDQDQAIRRALDAAKEIITWA